MDKHGGHLNMSGTGAGKTREMLATAQTYAARGNKVLIVTPKKCPKCFQCEDLVGRLLEHFPGQLEYVELDTTADAVQQFGVVLPPMLLVDDFIAAAGKVPIYDALVKLITAKLSKEP